MKTSKLTTLTKLLIQFLYERKIWNDFIDYAVEKGHHAYDIDMTADEVN